MAFRNGSSFTRLTAIICALLLCSASMPSVAQSQAQPPADDQAAKIPNEQLDSLVAPIALYPDPLLAQVLAASTYPLEIIQLQQWLAQHKDLKDKALADAVMKEDWDPSVQGLAPLPDVVKRLADDIKWTTELGNAFLAQESDVMDAVQRMRAKAQEKGNLKSNEQMKVETEVVENKQVIVIEQSNPQVVYVPSYDPVVVYGPPVYPYPPIYYPPAGYYAAGMAISFGVGLAIGAAWGGGWGYNCGWRGGNNNITINNNNNFVNNGNRNNGNRNNGGNRPSQQPGRGGNSNWQHNPQHRGGTPYSNKATANKYGGNTRGASVSDRQSSARQQQSRQQGGASNRAGGGASGRQQGGGGTGGRQQGGISNRAGGGAGGGDRVGNRSVSGGGSSRGSGGFGGGSGGYSGSSARSSSSRGSSSMGGGRSGGGGGGGRSGGGGRGGGGRRR
jgi:Protein of unknown function (DUF3300)